MATISTLAVNLIARTSVFDKKMRNSTKGVKTFQSRAKSAALTLAKFASGLGAAAGIGGMGFMIKQTMTMIDQTAKLSDRIGITTEALVGLRHAAGIAGVSMEALDKSLEIFVRRMGEVKSGSGEAKRGLEALGLSAERMIKLTPERALGVIADRINNLKTQAEKAAAAYFLFGRSGAQLLNLFEKGSAGLAEMQLEAEKLGLTFNRIDAAKVEAANDAITRMKAAFQGVANVITIELAPAIEKIADGLVPISKAIRVIVDEVSRATGGGVTITTPFEVGMILLEDAASGAASAIEKVAVANENVARTAKKAASVETKALVGIADVAEEIKDTVGDIVTKGIEVPFRRIWELSKSLASNISTSVIGPGKFQEFRSEFIDVSALNPTSATPQLTVLQQIERNGRDQTRQMETMNRLMLGAYQT